MKEQANGRPDGAVVQTTRDGSRVRRPLALWGYMLLGATRIILSGARLLIGR